MSWPQWSAGTQPAPVAPVINPTTPAINPAPAVGPPGIQYTPDQWAQLQQQNWNQWAQWQQQYQQWHRQYGAEYQKSINALAQAQQPPTILPNVGVPPPLPAETVKPPLPAEDPLPPIPSYSTMPPSHAPGYSTVPSQQPEGNIFPKTKLNWNNNYNNPTKRKFEQSNDPDPKRFMGNKSGWQSQPPPLMQQPVKPPKENIEELSEAEKKFDKQFADWEAQFNKWKEQNAEHPDKEQYREYEKKWETWRTQLLERREQMKRKRLGLPSDSRAAPNSQLQPSKGEQNSTIIKGSEINPSSSGVPLSKPPPNLNDEPLQFKQAKSLPETIEDDGDFLKPSSTGGIPGLDLVKDDVDVKPDKDDVIILDPEKEQKSGPDFDAISRGINTILGDQKLMSMLSIVSQNQNLKNNDNLTNTVARVKESNTANSGQGLYPDQSNHSYEEHSNQSDVHGQKDFVNNFDDQTRSSFTHNELESRYDAPGNFGRNQNNQFSRFSTFDNSDRFRGSDDQFNRNNERAFKSRDQDRFGARDDRFVQGQDPRDDENMFDNSSNQFGTNFGTNQDRFDFDQERFASAQDKFATNRDRFDPDDRFVPGGPNRNKFGGPNQDRMGPRGQDKFTTEGPNSDRFCPNQDRYGRGGPNQDKLDARGPNQDRFGPNQDRYGSSGSNQDRFGSGGPNQERFGVRGPNQDRFGPSQDRYGPNGSNQDRFGSAGPNQERFGARGPNQDRFGPNQDRYGPNGPNQDRFGSGGPNQERFGSNQDRFGPGGLNKDRFGAGGPMQDRYNMGGPNQKRLDSDQDRFGPVEDQRSRFGVDQDFGPNQRRPGPNQDRFPADDGSRSNLGSKNDRDFNQNQDRNFGTDRGINDRSVGSYDKRFGISGGSDVCEDDFNYGQISEDFSNAPDPDVSGKEENPWIGDAPYRDDRDDSFNEPQVADEPPVSQQDDILKPATVIDYDHKSLKPAEIEVLIEPIHMFDYRHKPLSRIPLPQRPKWLSETVRNIREFDPPLVRSYEPPGIRRYPSMDNWRNDRYQDDYWSTHSRRPYSDSKSHFDDRRPYGGDNRPYDEQRSFKRDRMSPDEWKPGDKKFRSDNRETYQESRKLGFKEDRPNLFIDEEKISDTEWPDDDELKEFDPKSLDGVQFSKNNKPNTNKNVVFIEDIISPPGRYNRPPRIVIILRGPPGSGKTFLAKLIKDKEVENGGSTPRILSLDDYFMVEQEKEVIEDGKKIRIKDMVYEYEAEMENSYRTSLTKSFKKTITDGYFSFIIVDNINDKVKYFGEMWSFAKQNGFQVYICQLDLDVQTCSKRNIHGRSEEDIQKCVAEWEPTPSHHPTLDATSLLQSASIPEVEMEEVNSPEHDISDNDDEGSEDQVYRSKWDNFDCSVDNLAKLDGVSKPLRTSRTMEEYLQLDTEWTPNKPTKPGQKRVRWADLEEQKQQEKMRAIGFVVGHTDWGRMMDPTGGSSALTQTKYIERIGRTKFESK